MRCPVCGEWVEEGEEYFVTIPEDATAEEFARVLRENLSDRKTVLTETYIDHEFMLKTK